MSVKQISVFLENKPGMMSNMTEVLAKKKLICVRCHLQKPASLASCVSL